MSVDWTSVVLQAVNFLVLVWILKRVLYGRVQALLEQRRAEVQRDLSAAAATRASAAAEREKAEAMARMAATEGDKALAEARTRAELERARLEAAARAAADEVLETGRKRLADEREEAGRQLEEAAARLSVSLAERLLGELDRAAVGPLLLERALARLESLEPARVASLRSELGAGEVTVALPAPLPEPERARVAARIAAKLGLEPARVAFAVEAEGPAAAEVRFPSSAVSFGWQGALERLAQGLGAGAAPPHGAPSPALGRA